MKTLVHPTGPFLARNVRLGRARVQSPFTASHMYLDGLEMVFPGIRKLSQSILAMCVLVVITP